MTTPHEADLAAYYDREAAQRAARDPDPRRSELRDRFADRLLAHGLTHVLEVGVGPGRDAVALARLDDEHVAARA